MPDVFVSSQLTQACEGGEAGISHTSFGQNIRVHPIEARARGREYLDAFRKQRNHFPIHATAFAAGVPERTHDGDEITPSLLLESLEEFGTFAFGGRWRDDIEVGGEFAIEVFIPAWRVA